MNYRCCRLRMIVPAAVLLCTMTIFVPPVMADMGPKEILAKADEARGNAEGMEWEIDIASIEGGRQQERVIRVTARTFNSLAEFLAPANVKGQKVLMLDRNMWFMKPGVSKAVPISPRQKLIGLAANGDIASTNYAGDYKVAHTGEDVFNGDACYVFDLDAIDQKATYDHIKYWISKRRLAGSKGGILHGLGKDVQDRHLRIRAQRQHRQQPPAFHLENGHHERRHEGGRHYHALSQDRLQACARFDV